MDRRRREGLTLAVDWSGRRTGAAEAIWLATVEDGALTDLENGRDREAVIEEVVRLAADRDASPSGRSTRRRPGPRWSRSTRAC